ncbi:hypothetical protein ABZT47_34675 [Sphaerisporangium sp. NPDC005289]|uniref:hypothetical protein n=1 Tax=Sphaerisporangium sp. NPDC005289 TaxID=3155247 RepID=UPI0033BD2C52
MMRTDLVQTIAGVEVHSDDTDPHVFYAIPDQPRFRVDDDGKLVFLFQRYRSPRKRPDGTFGGGFATFDVEFSLTDAKREAVLEELRRQVTAARGRPELVRLGAVQWAKGTAKLNLAGSAGGFVTSVSNPAGPSLFGKNITPFTVELTEDGAVLFEAAMKGLGGVVQVSYEMSAWARLPPLTGTAGFDSAKYYDFVQEAKDDAGCGSDEFLNKIRESIWSKEILNVTITSGGGADERAKEQIRQSLIRTLEDTTAKKMLEQLGRYEGDQTVLEDYETIRREYHKIKIDSFSYTITENAAALWPANPQGTLPNIVSIVGPGALNEYFKEIDLDHPFFRRLEVKARVNADFEALSIHSVDLHIDYQGRHSGDMHFAKEDDVQTFTCFKDGGPDEFTYQYRVNFKGAARAYESPPNLPGKGGEITLNVDDTGLLMVDIEAGAIEPAKFPLALVTVRYTPSTGPEIEEQYAVTADNKKYSLREPIYEPRRGPVRYRIEYHDAEGRTLTTTWLETVRRIYVNTPFHELRKVHISATGDLTAEIETISVDLSYADAGNDYSVAETVELRKGDTSFDWEVPVIDLKAGEITYSGYIRRYDGSVERIPPTVLAGGSFVVGESFGALMEVRIVPDRVDFTQVALVTVELRYGDDQFYDVLLRPGDRPEPWRVELTAPSERRYRWSATYYMKDQTERAVPERSSDNAQLVLPALPPA